MGSTFHWCVIDGPTEIHGEKCPSCGVRVTDTETTDL